MGLLQRRASVKTPETRVIFAGRHVKPVKPGETRCETAWQACETSETGSIYIKNIRPSYFFFKILRFHRFHTPATRFHTGFHPVSPVSHACHANLHWTCTSCFGFTRLPTKERSQAVSYIKRFLCVAQGEVCTYLLQPKHHRRRPTRHWRKKDNASNVFVLNNARSPALLNVVSRPAPGAVSSRDRIRTLLGPLRSSILAYPWASVLWTAINAVGEASAP